MAGKLRLRVDAGNHGRSHCPVSVLLPGAYRGCKAAVLRNAADGARIPCQMSWTPRGMMAVWLVDGLRAGETREMTLEPASEVEDPPVVEVDNHTGEHRADISIRGAAFTSYHYGKNWVRPFLHPLVGPHGGHMTRDWPIVAGSEGEEGDHPHHKSLWVAHGACNKVNHWNEKPNHGWQRHRSFTRVFSGAVFGHLAAKNDWCAPSGRKQFEEIREMCFYAFPGGERLFDIAITFRMTEGRVVFHDTKEAGLIALRAAPSMEARAGGRIENSYGGVDEAETWGKAAHWCDYSGPVNGKTVGAAIFDHEENPRYPTTWHVREYGLMAANCFGVKSFNPQAKQRGDMTFEKGSKTTWRYRVFIHKGDASKGKVKARFLDFAAPPQVTLE